MMEFWDGSGSSWTIYNTTQYNSGKSGPKDQVALHYYNTSP